MPSTILTLQAERDRLRRPCSEIDRVLYQIRAGIPMSRLTRGPQMDTTTKPLEGVLGSVEIRSARRSR